MTGARSHLEGFSTGRALGVADLDLRGLDDTLVDRGVTLVASLFVDERPPHGLLGLVDFRTCGHLSRLCLDGRITGVEGERVLLPGRPRLPAERIVVLGLGFWSSFDEPRYAKAVASLVDVLVGLRPRRAVVELPGRHGLSSAGPPPIEPVAAMSAFFAAVEAHPAPLEVESLVVVDDRAAQKAWADARGKRR